MSSAAGTYEVIIIGAGVAGVSLAHALAERGVTDVVVIEREPLPARHASGRSAQTLLELDANPVVQSLKLLGARWLRSHPPGFDRRALITRSGAIKLCSQAEWAQLRERAPDLHRDGLAVHLLDPSEACRRVPVLVADEFAGAAWLPDSGFIDVPFLIDCYIEQARLREVEFRFGATITAIDCAAGRAVAVCAAGEVLHGRTIVNAAGAWASQIARLAGASPIRLTPYRRSIATYPVPAGLEANAWPLVWSDAHRVYFRPGFDGLMVCPMDEDAMPACDPEGDVGVFASGFERLGRLAPALVPERLTRHWAGLRTFAPDRVPVVGEDPARPGFFWLAGQGGCGIETSPVLAHVAADLIVAGRTLWTDPGPLDPGRFSTGSASL